MTADTARIITRLDIAYDVILTTAIMIHNDRRLLEDCAFTQEECDLVNRIADDLETLVKTERS